jgi:hypothetical protein
LNRRRYAFARDYGTLLENNSVDSLSITQQEQKLSEILPLHSYTRTSRKVKYFGEKVFLSAVYDSILLLSSALPAVRSKFTKYVEMSTKM